jgi:hypothetical protein
MADIPNAPELQPTSDASITVDANMLRRIAEAADGLRGRTLALSLKAPLRDGGTGFGLVEVDPTSPPQPGEIRVRTPPGPGDAMRPAAVLLKHPRTGALIEVDTSRYDLVCWGAAAAEKFLLPYYGRFSSARDLQTLREAIDSEEIIAIAHEQPTFFDVVTDRLLVLPAAGPTIEGRFVPLSDWLAAQPPARP